MQSYAHFSLDFRHYCMQRSILPYAKNIVFDHRYLTFVQNYIVDQKHVYVCVCVGGGGGGKKGGGGRWWTGPQSLQHVQDLKSLHHHIIFL